jgi:hypothetical protein
MAELGNYSEVSLANLALQYLGRGKFIVALDEDSQAARVMRQHLPYARDAVLRAYPWNFAQRRAAIAADATAPDFEFSYSYTLPDDCLWCHTVYGGSTQDWKVEGRKVYTNMSAPLQIKYTARVTDLAGADPLFFQALAARLGSDCATTLTESGGKANDLWQVYQAKLREARAVDAQEGQAERFPQGSWHDGRITNDQFAPYADWDGN